MASWEIGFRQGVEVEPSGQALAQSGILHRLGCCTSCWNSWSRKRYLNESCQHEIRQFPKAFEPSSRAMKGHL